MLDKNRKKVVGELNKKVEDGGWRMWLDISGWGKREADQMGSQDWR